MEKKELNRKEYEKIKRMDHHAMKCYIESVYQSGYNAGAREEPVDSTHDKSENPELPITQSRHNKMPTIDQIRDEIGKIKGIGEKKQQAVIDAIITIWEQEGSRC